MIRLASLLIIVASTLVTPATTSARTSPVVVMEKVARRWFKNLATGEPDVALARSTLPFSLDRKKVIKKSDVLAKVYKKMAKKMAGKKLRVDSARPGGDQSICREKGIARGRVVIRLKIGKKHVDVCVLPGKYKVVGFAD